mmetsp:Transcript_4704/g.14204  ORF Transcript_4704/g.14204 Transcript_4704/m.14204 type:complete len:322 (+) Transcript_4704:241-1206(+)
MRGNQIVLALLALAGASMACSCLRESAKDKFDREDWVYTVSILSQEETLTNYKYTAEVKGVLKTYTDSFHYVGSIITIFSGKNSCQVNYLQVGQYYILGGSIREGQLDIVQCNTIYDLAQSPCLVPDCPKGCSSWFDGCNTHICKDGKSVGVTRKFCLTYQQPKCLEVTPQPVCPLNCKLWHDGCNDCQCNKDGSLGACTKRFCIRQGPTRCIKERDCVICTLALPTCPRKCKFDCEFVPGTCKTCPTTVCPKKRHTYFCDPFSTWSHGERKFCLKHGRDYDDLCCTQKDCCRWRGSKARYCRKYLCKTFKCVFKKIAEEA